MELFITVIFVIWILGLFRDDKGLDFDDDITENEIHREERIYNENSAGQKDVFNPKKEAISDYQLLVEYYEDRIKTLQKYLNDTPWNYYKTGMDGSYEEYIDSDYDSYNEYRADSNMIKSLWNQTIWDISDAEDELKWLKEQGRDVIITQKYKEILDEIKKYKN